MLPVVFKRYWLLQCWTHRNTEWLRTENKVHTSLLTPCSLTEEFCFFPIVFPFQVSFPSRRLDILLVTSSYVITWQLISQTLAFVNFDYLSSSPTRSNPALCLFITITVHSKSPFHHVLFFHFLVTAALITLRMIVNPPPSLGCILPCYPYTLIFHPSTQVFIITITAHECTRFFHFLSGPPAWPSLTPDSTILFVFLSFQYKKSIMDAKISIDE